MTTAQSQSLRMLHPQQQQSIRTFLILQQETGRSSSVMVASVHSASAVSHDMAGNSRAADMIFVRSDLGMPDWTVGKAARQSSFGPNESGPLHVLENISREQRWRPILVILTSADGCLSFCCNFDTCIGVILQQTMWGATAGLILRPKGGTLMRRAGLTGSGTGQQREHRKGRD